MSLAINKLISSLIQIVLFSLIPFVYWYFKGRKNHKFTEWIGLKRIKRIDKTLILSIFIVTITYLIIGIFLLNSLSGVNNATSEFVGLRFKAILPIIIYAALNTALPEEILFRGFVLKG
ncbi:membrane protease YdiL (CAAX protease family) [Peptoniphilus olsenii]|uniref:Membrane protease YdiL (CAAX protease family) n=1 Tax=Peptoniphilus olsenii TaxID=411570 RepID=A0ABV2JD62_9FIRM